MMQVGDAVHHKTRQDWGKGKVYQLLAPEHPKYPDSIIVAFEFATGDVTICKLADISPGEAE